MALAYLEETSVIPRELEVKILHLARAEKWPPGTIAAQLGVHHDVVERVLLQAGLPRTSEVRPKLVDPYLPFILETWAKYPRLHASRLYVMCKERGYTGARDHFRHAVAPYRPQPRGEAYLRLRTLPGEQAQVDWAHFGKLKIGQVERPLVAFVGVLSFSRALFIRFYLGQQSENFLRGHEAAFACWGGVPRAILYDNLKSAVLERVGDAIRFNPLLLDFAAHYGFEPRPVAPVRGNEKGRVERAIRYVRGAFFLGRRVRDLGDLNAQAEKWCAGEPMDRRWPDDDARSVREAFEEERPKLLALPPNPFATEERREVAVGKTPYVRFDGNDYSVPHALVRRVLVVLATPETVRILHGGEVVATHARSYDRHARVEDPAHVEALVQEKRAARKHRAQDRLAHAAPSSRTLLERLAERGANLGNVTSRLQVLLDLFGAEALEAAIREAIAQGVPHLGAVRQVLERERAARGMVPPLPIPLADARLRELRVRPHALETYDSLTKKRKEAHDGDEPAAASAR
ncbi:MAG TPA: IS21 family transposase [Gaiellaceae bacterium]|nr:IS21 family transposase [Gaiellaceae bacterium]